MGAGLKTTSKLQLTTLANTVLKAVDETAEDIKQQRVSKKAFHELKARVDSHFPLN
jgi:hypothetical protein